MSLVIFIFCKSFSADNTILIFKIGLILNSCAADEKFYKNGRKRKTMSGFQKCFSEGIFQSNFKTRNSINAFRKKFREINWNSDFVSVVDSFISVTKLRGIYQAHPFPTPPSFEPETLGSVIPGCATCAILPCRLLV